MYRDGCYVSVSYLCFQYAQQTFVFDPINYIMKQTSLPTATPDAPAAWNTNTPGCPLDWESGKAYAKGAIATFIDSNGFSLVSQCTNDANNLFCGHDSYNPITGQSKNLKVWESLGSCDSNIVLALSDYPGFENLRDEGGCPEEYNAGEAYVSGDCIT